MPKKVSAFVREIVAFRSRPQRVAKSVEKVLFGSLIGHRSHVRRLAMAVAVSVQRSGLQRRRFDGGRARQTQGFVELHLQLSRINRMMAEKINRF